MDGVLVDSEGQWERLFRELLAQHGLRLSEEDRIELYGCSDERENEILGRILGTSENDAAVEKHDYVTAHQFSYADIIIPGAKDLVERLHERGLRLALASSSFESDVSRMLCECDMDDLFDAVVTGDMVKLAKPDPAIYARAIALLGTVPSRAVAVDDSPVGVEAASGAGLRVIQFDYNDHGLRVDGADCVCTTHEAVGKAIDSIAGYRHDEVRPS
jgi:HAD superfamily hydrolase (TIGR01509 family)